MIWVDNAAKFLNQKRVAIEQENKVKALREGLLWHLAVV